MHMMYMMFINPNIFQNCKYLVVVLFAGDKGDKGRQGPKGMDGIIGFKGKKVFGVSLLKLSLTN